MSSTFGKIFSVTTWGESHGPAVGAVLDGCPAGGGSLPDAAERLGRNCWEYAQNSMQKWAALAEPVIILIMGGLVGFVVIAVLLPIFDLSAAAGR